MGYHYYSIHHLIIASDSPLPELISVSPQAEDVRIRQGIVPAQLPENRVSKRGLLSEGNLSYEVCEDTLLLRIPGVMNVLIEGSHSIVFQANYAVDCAKIRWYLFDVCLVLLLVRQGLFPFHGSSVQTPYGAVLFVGLSGWGKSTLAAKFLQEGHSLLTDDVCVVRVSENTVPYAYPSSRRLKLLDSSIHALGYNPAEFSPMVPDSPKKQLCINRSVPLPPQPLRAIYQLWPDEVATATLQPLSGHEKVSAVAGNTFLWEPVALFNLRQTYFRYCSAIAQTVSVKRLSRPHSGFDINAIYALLINDLQTMGVSVH